MSRKACEDIHFGDSPACHHHGIGRDGAAPAYQQDSDWRGQEDGWAKGAESQDHL